LRDQINLRHVRTREPSRSFFADFTFKDFMAFALTLEAWVAYDATSPTLTHRRVFSSDPAPTPADVYRIRTQYSSWLVFLQALGRKRYLEEQGADFDRSCTDNTPIGLDGAFNQCLERTAVHVRALADAVERQAVYRRLGHLTVTRALYPDIIMWPVHLRYLLDELQRLKVEFGEHNAIMGVRKTPQNTIVWEKTVGIGGRQVFTGAYEDVPNARQPNVCMTVEDWIRAFLANQSVLQHDMKMRKELINAFCDHDYPGLQLWLPDRDVWAFHNRDHDDDCPIWYLFGDPTRDADGRLRMAFLPQTDPRCADVYPCVFFPEPITNEIVQAVMDPDSKFPMSAQDIHRSDHWWNVLHTPVMDAIFCQQLGDPVADEKVAGGPDNPALATAVVMAMMGRWAFPLNAHDNWQRVLVIMGHAGTGKSLLLTYCMQQWFPRSHVAFLTSRMESTFGLMGLSLIHI
jgi:hypothetical protein